MRNTSTTIVLLLIVSCSTISDRDIYDAAFAGEYDLSREMIYKKYRRNPEKAIAFVSVIIDMRRRDYFRNEILRLNVKNFEFTRGQRIINLQSDVSNNGKFDVVGFTVEYVFLDRNGEMIDKTTKFQSTKIKVGESVILRDMHKDDPRIRKARIAIIDIKDTWGY